MFVFFRQHSICVYLTPIVVLVLSSQIILIIYIINYIVYVFILSRPVKMRRVVKRGLSGVTEHFLTTCGDMLLYDPILIAK